MSAITVEHVPTFVEDLFTEPVPARTRHLAPAPAPKQAAKPTSTPRATLDPTHHAESDAELDPASDTAATPMPQRSLELRQSPPPGRSATTPAPRVRLLPMPEPARPAPPATRRAEVPRTLEERVRVLRTSDRSPVLDAADEDRGPVPLHDPAVVARTVSHAVVEVLTGRRPVAQLARWVTPGVLESLRTRASLTARVLRPQGPGRATAVRRVRVCTIEAHLVEAGVVVDDGLRVRAVALRLETHRGMWRATSLEVG